MDKNKRTRYLKAMDIDSWVPRLKKEVQMPALDRQQAIAQMNWEELEEAVAKCTACPLHLTRTQTVFGVGNRQADLLVVGEAPGANEDRQGEPFVGRAGKLLNSMLQAIDLSREKIYIANVLKSRPPNNRDPAPEEVVACIPFLWRQIVLLKPKLILAVGRIAAHYLLNTTESMSSLRGREFTYGPEQTPLFITYHPAYLLRAPNEKRKAWDDMQRVAKFLNQLKK